VSSAEVPVGVGSLLSWIAGEVDAKHAVEIGAHGGVTGRWLLRGMDERGVLTSVAADEYDLREARGSFQAAGLTERVRAFTGDVDELLGRLSDASYDLVVMGSVGADQRVVRSHALRMLRPGGALIAIGVARPGTKDEARARRGFVRDLLDDDRLQVAVLPLHQGVVLARVLG
jgi:predicted O-methyltransferase YrrM